MIVSVTVDVVSVLLVIEPWVKLGTTGTAVAVLAFAGQTHSQLGQGTFSSVIIAQTYWTVNSLTNWPVATVPAPPAVIVITPAVVIVPAKSPAVPAAVDTWSEKLLTAPTVGADCDTASP